MAISKRMQAIQAKLAKNNGQPYNIDHAIKLLKEFASVKFNETVEVSINLGVDPKKSDQAVRGAAILPHGIGKSVRVAVFAQADAAKTAEAAGADIVGFEDLAEEIKKGNINFDVVIATPDTMRIVGQLGQILGPRGLMPNPKVGTVTTDVATAVKNAKAGQVQFRAEKAGIVHCGIGKINFAEQSIKENLLAVINELKKAKPVASKGTYLKKITLSTTMGPGLVIDIASLEI